MYIKALAIHYNSQGESTLKIQLMFSSKMLRPLKTEITETVDFTGKGIYHTKQFISLHKHSY